jgi:hypothetical protein
MSFTQIFAPPLIGGIAALMVAFALQLANSARRGSFSPSRFSRLMGFAAMASAVSAVSLATAVGGLWGPDQDPPGGGGPWGPYGPNGPVSAILLLAGLGLAHAAAAAVAAGSTKVPKRQRIATLGATVAMALQASVLPAVALAFSDDFLDGFVCGTYVLVVLIFVRWWRWPWWPGPYPGPDPLPIKGFGGRLFEGFNQSGRG